ncbi:MAG TPA: hypothetical protein PKJ97_02910 [Candidatus Bilamarchaeaceae archaeon]|nr:hypothetical protein [Candidatus Bilamarchaeaceae archaeon]
MPRGRRIIINRKINDEKVDRLTSINMDDIRKRRGAVERSLSLAIGSVMEAAQKTYERSRKSDAELRRAGILSIQDAYEYLRSKGMDISFRAFGGRIERRSIPSVKVGKKRYIPSQSLDDILNIGKDFYTIREAFELYKKYNSSINYRAFIGRVEKSSIPSMKIGTKRLIPRDTIDNLSHVAKKYYSVSQAIRQLHVKGVEIKRNAFERRLDRNRIPHVKIGGRRFIPRDVVDELVDKEIALSKSK